MPVRFREPAVLPDEKENASILLFLSFFRDGHFSRSGNLFSASAPAHMTRIIHAFSPLAPFFSFFPSVPSCLSCRMLLIQGGKPMDFTVDPANLAMIEALSNARSPSGFEEETHAAALPYLRRSGQVMDDPLRNLYCFPDRKEGKPLLMLDAHGDEVGFMIHSIHDNGTLRFVTLGRWNLNTLPSSKVRVRNALGEWIPGIIAAKPVHFMTASEREHPSLNLQDLVIDVGACSREEAVHDFHLRIGEPAVSDVRFSYDPEHDIMMGKGFDCRIGCAALIETLHRLAGESLAINIAGVLSAQEEVGERGVRVAVNRIAPDIAICFEGCPADDTFTAPYAIQTALKKGPMLRFMDVSVICSPRFQRFALDLAAEKGIPVQASVREGGGNNGAVIQTAGNGIPVIVIGIPVRYIHSHYGITTYHDFEAAVRLAVAVARSLTPEKIASF